MSNFRLLEQNINVLPLIEAVNRQPELWDTIKERTIYAGSAHKEASDIWIRYNDKKNLDLANPKAFSAQHIPIWYDAWYKLPELKQYIHSLMTCVNGEILGGILITRIPPKKEVYPHIDSGWHVDYYDKFYLQLEAGNDQGFYAELPDKTVEKFIAKPGDLYLFDNRGRHWIKNDSDEPRTTLIVCIRTEMFGRT